jgi:hypothetical protein
MQMLSEIAAHAFAKRFLGLPVLPSCLHSFSRKAVAAHATPLAQPHRETWISPSLKEGRTKSGGDRPLHKR